MNIQWNKCQGNAWCDLHGVDLSHNHFDGMEGVYIIWHGGTSPKTVRVGQGVIRDRLAAHRKDIEVQAYRPNGLYVVWAKVSAAQRDGVEAFLAQQLTPLVGDRFPATVPVQVNLPW